jgi:hypothetical protein
MIKDENNNLDKNNLDDNKLDIDSSKQSLLKNKYLNFLKIQNIF